MKEMQKWHCKQKSAFETNRRAPLLSRAAPGLGRVWARPQGHAPGVPIHVREARPHPALLPHCGEWKEMGGREHTRPDSMG